MDMSNNKKNAKKNRAREQEAAHAEAQAQARAMQEALGQAKETDAEAPAASVPTPTPAKVPAKPDEFLSRTPLDEDTVRPNEEERAYLMGPRVSETIEDGPLLRVRFDYSRAADAGYPDCDKLYANGKKLHEVGVIPRLRLNDVWKKACAYSKIPHKTDPEAYFGVTRSEWEDACKKISKHIKRVWQEQKQEMREILIQDMLDLDEQIYRALFISKADKIIELVRTAILRDIEENKAIIKKWKKIKNYPHRVALLYEDGGVFRTQADVEKLNAATPVAINSLNDVRKVDIYVLKNLLLDTELTHIVRDINEAFKEDIARRRDRRYAKRPYFFGSLLIALMLTIGFIFQYTLIKNPIMTWVINGATVLWIICMLNVGWAALRVKRRRRRNPDYVYFTKQVKNRLRFLTAFAALTLCTILVFYQRYDGYNNAVYYRDNDDGKTIRIAGLFNKDIKNLEINDTIDKKTVVEVDLYAFLSDNLTKVTLPPTVTSIDSGAFKGCEKLTTFAVRDDDAAALTTIESNAFNGCVKLTTVPTLTGLKTLGSQAFKNCSKLLSVSFEDAEGNAALTEIGESAFLNCKVLSSAHIGGAIQTIPSKAFSGCQNLSEITDLTSVTEYGDHAFYSCKSLPNLDLSKAKTIGKEAFRSCKAMTELHLPQTLKELGKGAFVDCTSLTVVSVPFVGSKPNAIGSPKLSDYITCEKASMNISLTLTNADTVEGNSFAKALGIKNLILGDRVKTIKDGAFSDLQIESITVPAGVTAIPDEAFANCKKLTTLEGFAGVKSIGSEAFVGCDALTTIAFPAVEEVGASACKELKLLATVDMPKLKTIGASAFEGCPAVTTIAGMPALTEIASRAFADCSSLATVELSPAGSLKIIGTEAFADCDKLTTLTLPSALTKISDGTFSGCNQLALLQLPSKITEIGDEAFRSTGLSAIEIPKTVTKIGKAAFKGCQSLTAITLPDSIEKVGKGAFENCTAIVEATVPFLGSSRFWYFTGFEHIFGSSSSVRTLTVTSMKKANTKAFTGAEDISTLTLGDSFTKVSKEAFKDQHSLVTLNLGKNITSIGASAFENCSNLTSVTFGSQLTTIKDAAFKDCSSLEAIDLSGTKLTTVRESTFEACSRVQVVSLPSKLEKIEPKAFYRCTYMTTVHFPAALTSIGEDAFRQCENLLSVELPAKLQKLGNNVFRGCGAMTTLNIGRGLKKLPEGAFMNCSSLQTIASFGIVEEIGIDAFSGCINLFEIALPNSLEELADRAFEDCGIVNLTIPNSVKKIGDDAFRGCPLEILTAPFIGETAKKEHALSYMTDSKSLTRVTLTKAKAIAGLCFSGQKRLETVILNAECDEFGIAAFTNSSVSRIVIPNRDVWAENTLLLPKGKVYASEDAWEPYQN